MGRGPVEKATNAFRYIAFLTAYTHTLRRVTSNEYRFLRAIQISAQPIPAERMPLVMEWYASVGKGWHEAREGLPIE